MRDQLATASEALTAAAGEASDHADRLADLSEQLGTLADQDRHVDHGRLARIQNALDDIQPAVPDEAAAHIAEADEAITAFRETIEGV